MPPGNKRRLMRLLCDEFTLSHELNTNTNLLPTREVNWRDAEQQSQRRKQLETMDIRLSSLKDKLESAKAAEAAVAHQPEVQAGEPGWRRRDRVRGVNRDSNVLENDGDDGDGGGSEMLEKRYRHMLAEFQRLQNEEITSAARERAEDALYSQTVRVVGLSIGTTVARAVYPSLDEILARDAQRGPNRRFDGLPVNWEATKKMFLQLNDDELVSCVGQLAIAFMSHPSAEWAMLLVELMHEKRYDQQQQQQLQLIRKMPKNFYNSAMKMCAERRDGYAVLELVNLALLEDEAYGQQPRSSYWDSDAPGTRDLTRIPESGQLKRSDTLRVSSDNSFTRVGGKALDVHDWKQAIKSVARSKEGFIGSRTNHVTVGLAVSIMEVQYDCSVGLNSHDSASYVCIF